MNLTDEMIAGIEERILTFAASRNRDAENAVVAQRLNDKSYLADQWAECMQRGLNPADAMKHIETHTRAEFKAESFSIGVREIVELDDTLRVVTQRIADARTLPPTVEPLVNRTERQMEEFVAFMFDEKQRARAAAMTRTDAADVYPRLNPDVQADRRLMAWLEANFSTAVFKDDPDHDATAILRMRDAIEKRQQARVDPKLFEWRDRLERAKRTVSFIETMRYLRGTGHAQPALRAV
jgi:hypothetical protein